MTVIGQVRIDTVLCKRPRQKKGRGRPRKYGTKYTKAEIKRLPLNKEQLSLYGREQKVNYRTAAAKAHFLKCPSAIDGLLANAPWQRNKPATAGRIRLGLLKYFSHVRIRDWWEVKSQKFQPPDTDILKQFEALL